MKHILLTNISNQENIFNLDLISHFHFQDYKDSCYLYIYTAYGNQTFAGSEKYEKIENSYDYVKKLYEDIKKYLFTDEGKNI